MNNLRVDRSRSFHVMNEREVEMLRLAAVAADLYWRLNANLPEDHLPEEAADVCLARDLADGLSKLVST